MSQTMYVESSITINCDVHDVFEYLKNAKNQSNYSAWALSDPNQKITTAGEDGTVGFEYCWESESDNVGAGKQTITNIVQDQEIHCNINFDRPVTTEAKSILKVGKEKDNMSVVTWSMEAPVANVDATQVGNMEGQFTSSLDESLKNLKNVLESK